MSLLPHSVPPNGSSHFIFLDLLVLSLWHRSLVRPAQNFEDCCVHFFRAMVAFRVSIFRFGFLHFSLTSLCPALPFFLPLGRTPLQLFISPLQLLLSLRQSRRPVLLCIFLRLLVLPLHPDEILHLQWWEMGSKFEPSWHLKIFCE